MLTAEIPSRWFSHPLLQKVLMALLLVACLGLLVINENNLRSNTVAYDDAVLARQNNMQLHQLMQSVISAESAQRSYLLTDNDIYRRDFLQYTTDIDVQLAQLTNSPYLIVRDSLKTLTELVHSKQEVMRSTVSLQAQGDREGLQKIVQAGRGRQLMLAIQAQGAHVIAFNNLRLQRLDTRLRQSMEMARLAMGGMIALTLLLLLVLWRQTAVRERHEAATRQLLSEERNQLEKTVQQRTQSLRRLAANLQIVREDERARLARELHDELGALLTAAKFDVARLRSRLARLPEPNAAETQGCLEHLGNTLNEGIALKRRIIEDLTPSSLANLGLTTALENLTRDYAATSGVAMQAHIGDVRLSQSNALTIYRLVQEALTNIGKYARAQSVDVDLRKEGNYARICVQDDGCGFDTSRLVSDMGTYGLAGMQFRVESQQGTIDIDSASGKGTRITALLPLLQDEPAPDPA